MDHQGSHRYIEGAQDWAMEKRRLGRTGMEVSHLSFGGLFVSKVGGDYEQSRDALLRGLELGVNYFDTAPSYANSEEVIGKALRDSDQPYYISTKLGGYPEPFDPRSKEHLRESLEQSLKLLHRDYVDILMIHEPDRPGHYSWFDSWCPVTGPVCQFLEECKKEGLIRYTGLGGTTVNEMTHIVKHGDFDVVLTAFNSSLLWREAMEVTIPAAREKEMGVVSGSPLQQGWLSRRYEDQVRNHPPWLSPIRREQLLRLYALLDEIDMPIAEVSLRFVLSNPQIDTVLMGARSVEEVEKNVNAANAGPLPRGILKELEQIYAMVPFRPCEEPLSCALANQEYRGPATLR
jgi:aryl-alcohol dehydrogenase-like predicted oxidoreductase